MKKIGLVFKETSEKEIKNSLKDSSGFFIIKYSGLSGPDLNILRQNLNSAKARLFVVKNTVAMRAFKDLGQEAIVKSIEGPCGLVFVKEEPVSVSKVLCNFLKEHEQLKLEAGLLDDKILEKKDIESMSRLPSKDVLRAKVVMVLNAPISGLVVTLNQVLRKFVFCLEQIRRQKEDKHGTENGRVN